ncbi:MAG: hypothetical protein AB7H97_02325 [Pseudobdellovibrionaceae bacterium]
MSTIIVCFSLPGWSTQIFLHDATSRLGRVANDGVGYGCYNGVNDTVYRLANTSQGTSAVTKTFAPTSTAPPCRMQTANAGEFLMWATPPLASGLTLSGNINVQAYCSESANGANFGFRVVIYRWSAKAGGIVSTVHTSSNNSSECTSGSSSTAKTIAAAAPTSTVFSAGDRIIIVFEMRAVGGSWGANGTRTYSFIYDGVSGGSGNTWVNFADTLSFSADSASAVPSVQ